MPDDDATWMYNEGREAGMKSYEDQVKPLVAKANRDGYIHGLKESSETIQNLEKSLAKNKPKALIQMATGSGKTFTSISFISA